MIEQFTRREFLAVSAGTGIALSGAASAAKAPVSFKTKLHKSLITRKISAKGLTTMKEAGFDGVECGAWNAAPADAEKARATAEKAGMKIHSVLRGWLGMNNPKSVASSVKSLETALKAAAGYGASAVLTVPCRVGGKGLTMPQPWEFDIEFDEKTALVTRVVKGDNTKYKAYIEAQNLATKMSREALKQAAATAEKTKVVIAVENVWNNLWVKPDLAASFVRSVGSPWVQFYFDIGNHVKYAPPEEWIRALGKMIVKCHVKDFKLKSDGRGGKFCNIRDGSVNWPLVRKELDKIGYDGWMTIEGSGGLSMAEKSKRLDLIVAGK
ncbi:MAG: sugar phosphate isomerase/epimerase family protein [Phycisphaerae bacterium]|jgi:hexulose-6-phosphate isomerase|nr:sugar phosphate isomerase/epimerase family protein [Phycisphaerae bacterium]